MIKGGRQQLVARWLHRHRNEEAFRSGKASCIEPVSSGLGDWGKNSGLVNGLERMLTYFFFFGAAFFFAGAFFFAFVAIRPPCRLVGSVQLLMLPIPQTASTSTSSTCHPPPVRSALYWRFSPAVKTIMAFWEKFFKVDLPPISGEIRAVKWR